ncbi:MAG TPA: FemAB family XrtA/PEP-CTERM system-associated protein [Casimicrobiaceae bacterium]|nr:FemAB family XrtA/PEP-CTERM system-associated protein [Casimicrobiaceae bacterium]
MSVEAVEVASAQAARMTSVRDFRASDAARFDAFVERNRNATFFHRLGWRDIFEEEFRHRAHYLIAERDGAIVGLLPAIEMRSALFGHSLVSLPFCVQGGPLADDAAAARALIDAAERRGRELGVDHVELRNRTAMRPDWPQSDLYVTFRRRLFDDVEQNLLAVPRKQRAMIRKGEKHGLASEIDNDLRRFYDLYADNMHRHGTPPFSRAYFERLLAAFGDACEILIVVDAQGKAVSGVLSFYFRDEVLPYYAGDTASARELAANDFKYWELMRRACERGVRVFDYGRSKRGTGSFDFKKNWGFAPEPLAYEYRLFRGETVPQHNPLNPRYRALIALWRRMPRAVVNRIGPHVVRGLG